MTTLLILLVATAAVFLIDAAFLRFGASWVGSKKATWGRSFVVALILGLVGLSAQLILFYLSAGTAGVLFLASLVLLIAVCAGSWAAISGIFDISWWRAVLVWLTAQFGTVAALIMAGALVRPFIIESFRVPTNAMAPAVAGEHFVGVCPHCGGPTIVPARKKRFSETYDDPERGICTRCLQVGEALVEEDDVDPGDRVIANKLLSPRRWDLIVFRFPPEPKVIYVKRLVGLPGETVFIRDGKVWVNGEQLELPDAISQLNYVTAIDGLEVEWGTEEHPFRLGPDEFCTLGDFSEMSADSRFWGTVPRENLVGVVAVTYWPWDRLRIWK